MATSRCQMVIQLLVLAFSMLLIGESQAATTQVPCPPNSSYGCRSPCYSSCDSLPLTACTGKCTPACMCNEGFVFQSADSDVCVPVSSCEVTCQENAHFVPCYRTPLPTCDNLGIHYQQSRYCMPRCVCDDGYVLSNEPNPRCINKKKC
ncbi:zonadhesin-like isoform X2 [Aquarana catesbeiana]|uniref:zonadhesin-like isoform X2 n=1 Tax=Aquarana catesbeiana TaxID=8400 RepID=UPI003CC9287A